MVVSRERVMDMPSISQQRVTELLAQWSDGDNAALVVLTPLIYEELRRLAHHHMDGQRPDHTLQTTALVNEAYLRLIDARRVRWQNRAHFFAVSAQLMRRILVDFARSRQYLKRGGAAQKVSLDEGLVVSKEQGQDLVALEHAEGSGCH